MAANAPGPCSSVKLRRWLRVGEDKEDEGEPVCIDMDRTAVSPADDDELGDKYGIRCCLSSYTSGDKERRGGWGERG